MTTWIKNKRDFAKKFAKTTDAVNLEHQARASSRCSDVSNGSDISNGSMDDDMAEFLQLAKASGMEIPPEVTEGLDEQFKKPKNPARKRPCSDVPPVKIARNRFEIPEKRTHMQDEDDKRDDAEVTPAAAPALGPKMPPIMITDVKTPWSDIYAMIKDKTKSPFAANYKDSKYRVATTSSDDFRAVSKVLVDNNIDFHTFALKEERTFKYVIRGLPVNASCDDIAVELKELGLPIKSVIQMKAGRDSKPLPLFLVTQFAKKTKVQPYAIEFLQYLTVSVEKYRNGRRIVQCYKCQGFFHGSSGCGHTPRCVKCGGPHLSKDCSKSNEVPATCANCNGSHTANFKGCPKYPKGYGYGKFVRQAAAASTYKVNSANDFPNLPPPRAPAPSAMPAAQAAYSDPADKLAPLIQSLEKMITKMSTLIEGVMKLCSALVQKLE